MIQVKGQVAFESLFIVLIILSAAIYITALYLNTNEATTSTAIVRDELFTQTLDMNSNVLLKYVHIDRNSESGINTIEVTTDPSTLSPADFNWIIIKDKLSKTTTITSFKASVNGRH